MKNNNMVSQAPFVEERNVGPLMTRVEEGKDEVRNYYIELARRLGLSTTLPGFTFDHNTPTGSGAQQNPSGTTLIPFLIYYIFVFWKFIDMPVSY